MSNVDYVAFRNQFKRKHGKKMIADLLDFTQNYESSHYKSYTVHPKPIALVKNLVEKEVNISLWTSNTVQIVSPILKELGIDKFFTNIVCRDDVDFEKARSSGI